MNKTDNYDPFGFKPLWDELLGIYADFSRVCDEQGLRYFVAYGTALGAARHKGFIPWDDDFDVQMPRDDYEQFIAYHADKLSASYKVVNFHNDRRFKNAFTKIMLCNSNRIESVEQKLGASQNQGIFIDIFPLDGYHENRIAFGIWWLRYMFYRIHEWHFNKYSFSNKIGAIKRIAGLCAHFLTPWIDSRNKLAERLDKLAKEVPFSASRTVGYVINPTFYIPKVHSIEEFSASCSVPFMDTIVKAPKMLDEYLKTEYGEYMRLPPQEKQKPHHVNGETATWRLGPST